jgi:hypothetical protein
VDVQPGSGPVHGHGELIVWAGAPSTARPMPGLAVPLNQDEPVEIGRDGGWLRSGEGGRESAVGDHSR